MPQQLKRLLAVLAVSAALLATAAAAAPAEEYVTLEPAGSIAVESLGALTFSGSGSIEIEVECAFMLSGALSEITVNAAGNLVGIYREGTAESCSTGTAEVLFEEPAEWQLVVASEAELTSPTLLSLTLQGAQMAFDMSGVDCRYAGDVPLSLPASGEPLSTELATILSNRLAKTSGSIFCPTTGAVSGTLALSAAQVLDTSTVRLTASPTFRDFGRASGSQEFTFVNRSGADQTVRSVAQTRPDRGYVISRHDCAEGPNLERGRLLKDINVDAERSFCRATVVFTSPQVVDNILNFLLVRGDPGVTTLLGYARLIGR